MQEMSHLTKLAMRAMFVEYAMKMMISTHFDLILEYYIETIRLET